MSNYVTEEKHLHDIQMEMDLIPVSHMVSRISFRLSDITVVKPEAKLSTINEPRK